MKHSESPRTERLVPAGPILRICECLEAAGDEVTRGDDTARGIACAAATIKAFIANLDKKNATEDMGL